MKYKHSTTSLGMLFVATFAFCCSSLFASISGSHAKGGAAPAVYASNLADTDGDGVKDKKDKCPGTPKGVTVDATGCPVDGDKDGVADYLDKCPKAAGLAALGGCPDGDKDGIADKDDNCPDVPGIARFSGCPDSDGDGIEDSKDNCPNAKGLDQFKGCPDTDGDGVEDGKDKCSNTAKGVKVDASGCPLDTDGDGITDDKDKCPHSKGEGSENGCPEIKVVIIKELQTIAQGINFETNKAALKASSYPMLDEMVKIMNDYPDYILKMGGHTDNVGDDKYNFDLSQQRMDGVKAYLVSKGIPLDRIQATGYGETMPKASNNTAEGRMQNRRVELELIVP